MMTYRGWTWCDDATEEQTESATNKTAVERLAGEARSLYDSIPQPRRRDENDDDDRGDEPEFETDEEFEAWKKARADRIREAWGQIHAIEELLAARGARFARDYEHWNEDERLIEHIENRDG